MFLLNFSCSSPVKAQSKEVTLSEKIISALISFKGDILIVCRNERIVCISVILILFSRFIRFSASGKFVTDGNGFKFIADDAVNNSRCDIGIFVEHGIQTVVIL